MTDITSELKKIQVEEVRGNAAVSAPTGRKIGSSINWIIDNRTDRLGDVVTSILTEAQFQAERSTDWVLMKGQSIAGSDLETLTGISTLPDARGEFIRSLDNGRGVDSGRVMASTQAQDLQSHNHRALGGYDAPAGSDTVQAAEAWREYNNIDQSTVGESYRDTSSKGEELIEETGGTETRPRNVALNHFIKINN